MEPALIILIPLPALFFGMEPALFILILIPLLIPSSFFGDGADSAHPYLQPLPQPFFWLCWLAEPKKSWLCSSSFPSPFPSPFFWDGAGSDHSPPFPASLSFLGDGANSALPHPHPPFPALYGRDPGLIIFISLPFPSPLWDGASSALPSPLAQLFLGWSWLCSSSFPSPSSVFSGMEPTLIILIPVPFPSPLWEGSSSDHLYPPPLSQPFL